MGRSRESRVDSLSSVPSEEPEPVHVPLPVQPASIQFQPRDPTAAVSTQQQNGHAVQKGHVQVSTACHDRDLS